MTTNKRETPTTTRRGPKAKGIGRPVGSNRDDTITRILASALKSFTSKGYAGTTFRDISKGADITSAAIYQYFDSKSTLYGAVLDSIYETLLPRFQEAINSQPTLKEQMRHLVDTMVELHEKHPDSSAFLTSTPIEAQRHPELKVFFATRNSDMRSLQKAMFEKARKRGDIDKNWSTNNLLMMFYGSMAGMATYQLSVEGTSLREAADIYLTMMESHLFR